MVKEWFTKRIKMIWEAKTWIIITAIFLFIVHCLFKIHPENDFFSAEWEAGDLISFVGTIVLGYVAYSQTKKAAQMAEQADKLNNEFLRMQEREYIPVVKCLKDHFCGIEMLNDVCFAVKPEPVKLCTGVFHSKNEDDKEDPYVGYSLMIANDVDIDNSTVSTRIYELHLEYEGKYGIRDITIDSLSFYDCNAIIKDWSVNEKLSASLGSGEQLVIFIYLLDKYGSDLIDKISKSNKMVLHLTLHCYDGSEYNEEMVITKQFIDEYVPSLDKDNVELMVSANYEIA